MSTTDAPDRFKPLGFIRQVMQDDDTLTAQEKAVLIAMVTHTDNASRKVRFSLTGIARHAGVKRTSIPEMMGRPRFQRYLAKVDRPSPTRVDVWLNDRPTELVPHSDKRVYLEPTPESTELVPDSGNAGTPFRQDLYPIPTPSESLLIPSEKEDSHLDPWADLDHIPGAPSFDDEPAMAPASESLAPEPARTEPEQERMPRREVNYKEMQNRSRHERHMTEEGLDKNGEGLPRKTPKNRRTQRLNS